MRTLKRIGSILLCSAILLQAANPYAVMAEDGEVAVTQQLITQDQNIDEVPDAVRSTIYNCTECQLVDSPETRTEIGVLYSGQQVFLMGVQVWDESQIWYYVSTFLHGVEYRGYVSGQYVMAPEEDTIDMYGDATAVSQGSNDFESSISGFPESYKASLRTLHSKYPNWIFVPQITNVDWNTFINAEMYQARNLVPRSMDDAYKGRQSWAYNPVTNEFIGLSGNNWVQASQTAVEYYADPRNSLTENTIFQFELLTYNGTYQTENGVESIINGTFMSHAVIPGDSRTYGQAFCQIGADKNISPFMLAARVRQEQGAAGSSPLISGTYPGYEGYYNYFNIGAYGDTETEIYTNGLQRAKDAGWNSRYGSIAGGADVLSGNYISKGQDTLYLQKFDVDDSYYGMFSHQYMQNLLGAYNESVSVYNTYSGLGIVGNSFVFKIPVYNNMPASACPKPVTASDIELTRAFVSRLYSTLLQRNPDPQGLENWTNQLVSGKMTAAKVVCGFTDSAEFKGKNLSDEEYVERLYLTMLNRSSDPTGKSNWLAILQNGCSRQYVLAGFFGSSEFTTICNSYGISKGSIPLTEYRDQNVNITRFVSRFYKTMLNRNADPQGLNTWTANLLLHKKTPYEVACGFINSPEFVGHNYSNEEYVRIMYTTFLDRDPDPVGMNNWVNRLNQGESRISVAKGFANSQEFLGMMKRYGL